MESRPTPALASWTSPLHSEQGGWRIRRQKCQTCASVKPSRGPLQRFRRTIQSVNFKFGIKTRVSMEGEAPTRATDASQARQHLEEEKGWPCEQERDSLSMDTSGVKSTDDLGDAADWSPPNSHRYKRLGYGKSMKEKSEDMKIYRAIEALTDGFKLTYNEVKDRDAMKGGLLAKANIHEVKDIIKKGRQRYLRSQRQVAPTDLSEERVPVLGKRTATEAELVIPPVLQPSRPRLESKRVPQEVDLALAKIVIEGYTHLHFSSQAKLLNHVQALLTQDQEFYQDALEIQVQEYRGRASYLYESRDYAELKILLSSLSPMAAILINIEIGKRNPQFTEQGYTLSYTLLPYINKTLDYSFITQDMVPVFEQYLAPLILHIKDKQSQVEKGFLLFALHLNPSSLHDIIHFQNNKEILRDTLSHLGFSEECTALMSTAPSKYLWGNLLTFFKGKLESMITLCIQILSRMDITSDPGPHMNKLIDFFAQRSILADELVKQRRITVNLPKLLIILETLCFMEAEAIVKCLSQPSQDWEKVCRQLSNFKDLQEESNYFDKVMELYQKSIAGRENPLPLEAMLAVSKQMCEVGDAYRHNDYQCMIAAASLSLSKSFKIIVVPTGSGKTWIQGLIAMHYCLRDKQVCIIEPTEELAEQAACSLTPLDYGITVRSLQQYYQDGSDDEVLILDEYDQILSMLPYLIQGEVINGPWQFRGKNVYAFTATSSRAIERLVHKTIAPFDKLAFTSEYEFVHGTAPLQDGHIKTSSSQEEMYAQLKEVVAANYDQMPLIIILDESQVPSVRTLLKEQRLKVYEGASKDVLVQIRDQTYGVLLIRKAQSRGLDIKFARSALVLIIAEVGSLSEYHQMLGRSSRVRGVCEGILFSSTGEKASMIIEKLKQNEVAPMMEYEGLMPILEANAEDKGLIKMLKKQQESAGEVRSMKKLEQVVGAATFQKLKRNVKKQ